MAARASARDGERKDVHLLSGDAGAEAQGEGDTEFKAQSVWIRSGRHERAGAGNQEPDKNENDGV